MHAWLWSLRLPSCQSLGTHNHLQSIFVIVHQHGVVKKMAILRKRKDNKACGGWGVIGKWQAQVKLLDVKTARQLHLSSVGPMKCQAHLLMLVWFL